VVGIFIFIIHWRLVQKYQKTKNIVSEREKSSQILRFNKKHENLEILFGDFKDNSYSTQAYLLILTGRNIIFNLIIVLLTSIPVAQVFMIVIMHFIILGYFAMKRPLKSMINLAQQTSFELALLTINLSWLGMTIIDTKNNTESDLRDDLGDIVIMVNMIYTFIPILFLFLKLLETGKEIKEFFSTLRQKTKTKNYNPVSNSNRRFPRRNDTSKRVRVLPLNAETFEQDSSLQIQTKDFYSEN